MAEGNKGTCVCVHVHVYVCVPCNWGDEVGVPAANFGATRLVAFC